MSSKTTVEESELQIVISPEVEAPQQAELPKKSQVKRKPIKSNPRRRFKGVLKTISTTKNFNTALLSKFTSKVETIEFRNGSTFKLNWTQFTKIRDNYAIMNDFRVSQVDDNRFKLTGNKIAFEGSLDEIFGLANSLLFLRGQFGIVQLGDDLFQIKNDVLELVGSMPMLLAVHEMALGVFDCDCKGKIVLDVGGFQGESAAYFSSMGAKKVVIYEPVLAHHKFITQNVILNRIDAEIHDEGLGESCGFQTVFYKKTDLGFGCETGQLEMQIKTCDAASIIEESCADVAKFDCEGAEINLLSVPNGILRKIGLYLIEIHSPETRTALFRKFRDAGFMAEKELRADTPFPVLFFKKLAGSKYL